MKYWFTVSKIFIQNKNILKLNKYLFTFSKCVSVLFEQINKIQ